MFALPHTRRNPADIIRWMNANEKRCPFEMTVHFWHELDQLKFAAMAQGCTPDLFAEALELVGIHPEEVSQYLRRKGLIG